MKDRLADGVVDFRAERLLDIPEFLSKDWRLDVNAENSLAECAECYLIVVRTPPGPKCSSKVFVDDRRVNNAADPCATDGVLEKIAKGCEHALTRYCLIGMMRARKGTPSSGRNTPGLF